MVGSSRLSRNVNQLGRAVHTSSLPVTPETEEALKAACLNVRHMRQDLPKALSLPTESAP